MSEFFEGSVVLEQNSVGHSFLSGKSACTRGYFTKYFEDASLPSAGTVCEVDVKPLVDGQKPEKRSLRVIYDHLRR